MFDWFLHAAGGHERPVFVISGNHDSADRLGFGSQLLVAGGVHLAAVFSGGLEHYLLEDAFGPVALLVNNAGVAGQALFRTSPMSCGTATSPST